MSNYITTKTTGTKTELWIDLAAAHADGVKKARPVVGQVCETIDEVNGKFIGGEDCTEFATLADAIAFVSAESLAYHGVRI